MSQRRRSFRSFVRGWLSRNERLPRHRALNLETLEQRSVMTTTVFLDFGEGFVGAPLLVRSHIVDEAFSDGGIQGPDLNDGYEDDDYKVKGLDSQQWIEIKSLQELVMDGGWDYDGNSLGGTLNDYTKLRDDIVAMVTRQFAPFNVDVKVAAAEDFADIRTAMRANNGLSTGKNDAYVLVAPMFLVDSEGNPQDVNRDGITPDSVGLTMGLWGRASGDDLGGFCLDCIYDRNDTDESAFVFAESVVFDKKMTPAAAVTLANVASHEAAHTFGLPHTVGDFDVISDGKPDGTRRVFSRYPVDLKSGSPFLELGIGSTLNSWEWLREDDDIGLRPGTPEFVTGTDRDDVIVIEREGDHGRVRINYRYLGSEVEGYTYPIALDRGIIVEAGPGADALRVDPNLGATVTIFGGPGATTIEVEADDQTTVTVRPDGVERTSIEGTSVQSGVVQYGSTTIRYDDFTMSSSVYIQSAGFAIYEPAPGETNLGIHGRKLDEFSSKKPGIGLSWNNIGLLTIDTESRGGISQPDTIFFASEWPIEQVAGKITPSPIQIRTGGGINKLALPSLEATQFVDTTGMIRWDAAGSLDRLEINSYSRISMSQDLMVFDHGSLSFDGDVESLTIRGDLNPNLLILQDFPGSVDFQGRGGADQLILSGFQDCHVFGIDRSLVIQSDSSFITAIDIPLVTIEDLANRPNEFRIARYSSNYPGELSVNTGDGEDRVIVDESIPGLSVDTGDGPDYVTVLKAAADVRIHTWDGDDTLELQVSPQMPWSVWGDLDLATGEGNDQIIIDDSLAQAPVGERMEYRVEAAMVERSVFASRFGPTFIPLPLVGAENLYLLTSNGPDHVTINDLDRSVVVAAQGGRDSIDVRRVPRSAEVSIAGGSGDDDITLGAGSYLQQILGSVDVDGGGDTDTLTIADTDAFYLDQHYTLETGTFSKSALAPSFPLGTLVPVVSSTATWSNIVVTQVLGSNAGATFDVNEVAAGEQLILQGGDEQDHFRVRSATQYGPVAVIGGAPDTYPGDDLIVLGADDEQVIYQPDPNSPHSGRVTSGAYPIVFSQLEPVTLDGFAQVTFQSPLSMDAVTLEPAGTSLAVRGTSSNPLPASGASPAPAPVAWELLLVKNTAEVVIDLATNDARNWSDATGSYQPVPNDEVTITSGALQTPGLEQLTIASGAGLNRVHDYSFIPGQPAAATVVVDGTAVDDETYHLIHGSAAQLLVAHPSLEQTVGQIQFADGTIAARFEDRSIEGGVVILDPQHQVTVNLGTFDAVMTAGGDGRQRFDGESINPLEIAPADDGRLLLNGTGNLDPQAVLFPTFGLGALYGLDIPANTPLSVCGVTNTADSGPGSLRAALDCASAAPADRLAIVVFAIPSTDPGFIDVDSQLPSGDAAPDVFEIRTQSALPADYRGRIVVNGQTQQLATGETNIFGPEIVINGVAAGAGVSGIQLRAIGSQVHGVVVQNFSGQGIYVEGNGNRVTGSFIGTDATGFRDAGNLQSGIVIHSGSGNVIGGTTTGFRNVISGNGDFGLQIVGNGTGGGGGPPVVTDNPYQVFPRGNWVLGNFIGVGADGSTPMGNQRSGIEVRGSVGNVIGLPENLPTPPGEVVVLPVVPPGGNVIGANGDDGITLVESHENTIQANHVGVDFLGWEARGNERFGIWLIDSAHNQIGGGGVNARNVISANVSQIGVYYAGSTHNKIQGNYLGLDSSGRATFVNQGWGIDATYNVAFNVIGVDGDGMNDATEGNVIGGHRGSYNSQAAVYVVGHDNVVAGNLLGLDATGVRPAGNVYGVQIAGERNRVGTDGNGVSDELERNVIAANDVGIAVFSGVDNVVAGNWIGTDVTGRRAVGNGGGIGVGPDALRTRIGTNADGVNDLVERNVVAGQGGIVGALGLGIYIAGSETIVSGNYVGLAPDGVTPMGNANYGVLLAPGASRNVIGTDGNGVRDEVEGNQIAHNGADGIAVVGGTSIGNTLRRNAIYANRGLAIDLADNGVTENDLRANVGGGPPIPPDVDSGPNLLQNFPEIGGAGKSAVGITVTGSLQSTPNTTFVIDLYRADGAERTGRVWIGSVEVTTNRSGSSAFSVRLPESAGNVGNYVTATATQVLSRNQGRIVGNTSEFAPPMIITSSSNRGSAALVPLASASVPNSLTTTLDTANHGTSQEATVIVSGVDSLFTSDAVLLETDPSRAPLFKTSRKVDDWLEAWFNEPGNVGRLSPIVPSHACTVRQDAPY